MNEPGAGNNDPFVRARAAGFQSIQNSIRKAWGEVEPTVGPAAGSPEHSQVSDVLSRAVDQIVGDLSMRNVLFEAVGTPIQTWPTTPDGWREQVSTAFSTLRVQAFVDGQFEGFRIIRSALNRIKAGSAEVLPNRGLSEEIMRRYEGAADGLMGHLVEVAVELGIPEDPLIKASVFKRMAGVEAQVASGLSLDEFKELQGEVFGIVTLADSQNLTRQEAVGVVGMVESYRRGVGDDSFYYCSYSEAANKLYPLGRLREKAGMPVVDVTGQGTVDQRFARAQSVFRIATEICEWAETDVVVREFPVITEDEARFAGSVYDWLYAGESPAQIVQDAQDQVAYA